MHINKQELQNLRHLIGSHETAHIKLNNMLNSVPIPDQTDVSAISPVGPEYQTKINVIFTVKELS